MSNSPIDSASAFLLDGETVYYTTVPAELSIKPSTEQPWTPMTALIEGIWAQEPSQANRILRNRIYSFTERTPLCDGMIKVAAKRARLMSRLEAYAFTEQSGEHLTWIEVRPSFSSQVIALPAELESRLGQSLSPEAAAALARELSTRSDPQEKRFESDRAVGGVLLSSRNEVLSLGWNTNARQRIHHCEVNLIRGYLHRHHQKIPANATLIVTLKPCALCAAQLFTFSEDFSSMKVLYLEDDPGPAAANSVLIRGSDLWKKAGSPAVHLAQI